MNDVLNDYGVDGVVYSPYYLYKTHKCLVELKKITLPSEMRSIIETVYCDHDNSENLKKAKHLLEENREKMNRLAALSMNSLLNASSDTSESFTRFSEVKYVDILLVKKIHSNYSLELLSGDNVKLSKASGLMLRKEIAGKLQMNIVSVPKNKVYLPSLPDDLISLFRKYVFISKENIDLFNICIVDEFGRLSDVFGNKIEKKYFYDHNLGYYLKKE